jgi:hypothetical protein
MPTPCNPDRMSQSEYEDCLAAVRARRSRQQTQESRRLNEALELFEGTDADLEIDD